MQPTTTDRPGVRDLRLRTSLGSRLRFWIRLLGLTAGVVLLASLVYASTLVRGVRLETINLTIQEALQGAYGSEGTVAAYAILISAGLVVLALVMELLGGVLFATGRRSLAGTLAAVQIVLATTLLVGVNLVSFERHTRFDLTRDAQFTLPAEVVSDLQQLREPTTIVVYQQHKTFGQFSDRPDAYDYAAERKLVEKVRDLVDQFRQLGPRFDVHVLDVEEEGFDRHLQEVTADKPGLREAIATAPENSIFFYANGRVQRLSFHQFYQLDKSASRVANGGRGNLVLIPQGLAAFVGKILAIEERKPVVGVAVIHEYLTTHPAEGRDRFTLAGLGETLKQHGFEVRDIVLKKWGSRQGPTPAAYTYEESRYETLTQREGRLKDEIRLERQNQADILVFRDTVRDNSLEELATKLPQVPRQYGRTWTARFRDEFLEVLNANLEPIAERLEELESNLQVVQKELSTIREEESLLADRRIADVNVKLDKLLAECDLLILPRMTIYNAARGESIPPELHRLENDQAKAIQDYLKLGKPLLACFGPVNDSRNSAPVTEPFDDVEQLLAQFGIELGPDTILFDTETEAFSDLQAGRSLGGGAAEIPPLQFDESNDTKLVPQQTKQPNPISRSMQVTARSVDKPLDLLARSPRAVYLKRNWQAKLPFAGTFVYTDSDSWNEAKPFGDFQSLIPGNPNSPMVLTNAPRFQRTPETDPKYGTPAAERRGPFPVGVAIEAEPPINWYQEDYASWVALSGLLGPLDPVGILPLGLTVAAREVERSTSRIVVLGHGGLFLGDELKPAQAQFLLQTCNWLLNRNERLPAATEAPWSYPRVALSEQARRLWTWLTVGGLPVLFAYLGMVVWLIRRVR